MYANKEPVGHSLFYFEFLNRLRFILFSNKSTQVFIDVGLINCQEPCSIFFASLNCQCQSYVLQCSDTSNFNYTIICMLPPYIIHACVAVKLCHLVPSWITLYAQFALINFNYYCGLIPIKAL